VETPLYPGGERKSIALLDQRLEGVKEESMGEKDCEKRRYDSQPYHLRSVKDDISSECNASTVQSAWAKAADSEQECRPRSVRRKIVCVPRKIGRKTFRWSLAVEVEEAAKYLESVSYLI